ncbi:MAG: helix-turn-helix domain-containing protein [Puniceicoccales bacterium]|jgi:hypothetical protein|nr:helix-turn-helix domain-containing protein [Puniceicoccales bacterium]
MNANGKVPSLGGTYTYLTRKEAAEYLRVRADFLAHHPKNIPCYKIFGRVLYIKEELDDIIRRNRQGGES